MTDLSANATPSSNRLDAATSKRLAKLRAGTGDVSQLLHELKTRVGARPVATTVAPTAPAAAAKNSAAAAAPKKPAAKAKAARPPKAAARVAAPTETPKRPPIDPAKLYRKRRIRMAAASAVLLVSLLASLRVWSARPVAPSMTFIASVHDDLIASRVSITKVDSVEEANAALQLRDSDAPQVPLVTELARISGCATRDMQSKHLACIMLKDSAGWPVTLLVADARDIRESPDAPKRQFNGRTYSIHTVDGLTIVSGVRDRKWICLISAAPEDRLLRLASQSNL